MSKTWRLSPGGYWLTALTMLIGAILLVFQWEWKAPTVLWLVIQFVRGIAIFAGVVVTIIMVCERFSDPFGDGK